MATRIIDADSHVSPALGEGPMALFKEQAPKGRESEVPYIKDLGDGRHATFIGDEMIGRPMSMEPRTPGRLGGGYDSAGHHGDIAARLEFMDENDIQAQIVYPAAALSTFMAMDAELQHFCVRVTNDWHRDWAKPAKDRLFPIGIAALGDMDATVREVGWLKSEGFAALLFPNRVHELGLPHIADTYWDPMWRALQDHDLPLSFHPGVGSEKNNQRLFDRAWAPFGYAAAAAIGTTESLWGSAESIMDVIFSGVLQRFPTLKIVLGEGGVGYIPFLLESCDYHFDACGVRKDRPDLEMLPSEYFKRQIYVMYWFERAAPTSLLDYIPYDHVMIETDYDHRTGLYGYSRQAGIPLPKLIHEATEMLSPEHKNAIMWKTAAALYSVPVPAGLASS